MWSRGIWNHCIAFFLTETYFFYVYEIAKYTSCEGWDLSQVAY